MGNKKYGVTELQPFSGDPNLHDVFPGGLSMSQIGELEQDLNQARVLCQNVLEYIDKARSEAYTSHNPHEVNKVTHNIWRQVANLAGFVDGWN
jgi:hypothetical protein